MQKKIAFIFTAFIIATVTGSCVSRGGITPSNNYITRNYKVTEFDQIDISTVADIYYTQSTDNSTSLEIYGPDNIIDLIQVATTNSTLVVKMKKKNINNVKGMKVRISTPDLNRLSVKGVGNTYIDGLNTQSFRIDNEGVGNIRIKGLICESAVVRTDGVGNVELAGKCVRAALTSQGVGNLKAEQLECEQVDVTSDGVGNVTCHATKSLSATTQGIGNIRYKGNPEERRLNKSGIGSIKQL